MQLYSIPAHVQDYITRQGFSYPMDDMKTYIEAWVQMLNAEGSFYDYNDSVNGQPLHIHRRSIHPADRVADEWASLIMDDKTEIATDDQECTDWLASWCDRMGFFADGQRLVKRAFALGTGAWCIWYDADNADLKVKRYDARMTVPLSWEENGHVTECAFASQVVEDGKRYDQLQMHVLDGGTYHIKTVYFDSEGEQVELPGVNADFDSRSPLPTFAIVKPAIENTLVDFSPYGQSVYANAVDAMQGVDLCYDAIFNEVDLGKMRVFVSDMLVDYQKKTDEDGNVTRIALPFGRDNTVYRKVQSNEDMVQGYAPALRTDSMIGAYRMALQTMGDLCGFGLNYFDIDDSGGVKTATEVSSDNSALMRNIRKHENALEDSIATIAHAVLHFAREFMGIPLPPEGDVHVNFDDSIISDTAAEKAQDMAEVGVTMNAWEYRMKWYAEDEATAKANVPGGVDEEEPASIQKAELGEGEPKEPEGE